MLVLGSADTIGFSADVASKVNVTVTGEEMSSSNVGTYKNLWQGQAPSSATTEYTAPTGGAALISHILAYNTDTVTRTLTVYVKGTAASNAIGAIAIPAGGMATFDRDGWNVKGAAAGILLAVTQYAPATQTNLKPPTTGLAAFDTTNLTVTFTAPPSGRVLVRLTANCYNGGTAANDMWWALINGSTKYGPTGVISYDPQTSPVQTFTLSMALLVTGLTAGTTYTFDWAGAQSVSASDWEIACQDAGGSTGGLPPGGASPAVMEVWAA